MLSRVCKFAKRDAPFMSDDRSNIERYDFRTIEQRQQQRWREASLFKAENTSGTPKFYGLVMFPYPSGAGLSVGHCRNYIPLDVMCRKRAMQGYNVLQPMGWDAFGQPAENEAIKRGRNPADMVPEYAANYRRQLNLTGIAYDWSREINSSLPEYYRWTQWIFLQLHRRGLAYRSQAPVNWCPSDKTVLANEEVVNGRCWRCDTPVEKRAIPQWFFRITDYAEPLLHGLTEVQWPEGVKQLQANWIGRSEGAEIEFIVEGHDDSVIKVFTTRPDTLWGATFMVLAPEHPLVDAITDAERAEDVSAYRERASRMNEIDRQNAERAKTGVHTGAYAINPVNGAKLPVFIADYVLMGYGTGAIMAVPAHDQRDFEFARKFDVPIVLVYKTDEIQHDSQMTEAMPTGGTMQVGGPFDGSPNNKSTVAVVIKWLDEQGWGKGVVNYRLRDWLISRQRYWGAPIPMIHCADCGTVPVPEEDLPVLLPPVKSYEPTGTGESPLAAIPEFVETTCPQCGHPARRETDTMGGSACSSWYFLRFADPHNDTAAFSQEATAYWMPVDLYCGGAEHAVGHLLYSRFWTRALKDCGFTSIEEPFKLYRNQGSVLAYTAGRRVQADEPTGDDEADPELTGLDWKVIKPEERDSIPESEWVWRWVRMSKSKGNVVTPDEMAEKYGADSLRLFLLFVAPYEENVQWSDTGIEAANRYLNRLWRLLCDLEPHYNPSWRETVISTPTEELKVLRRRLHQTIQKVSEDIENFRFNTAVAQLMAFTNELSAFRNNLGTKTPSCEQQIILSEAMETMCLLLSPFVPHFADEWWTRLGKLGYTYRTDWPLWDVAAATEEEVTIVVQINGKVKDRITIPVGTETKEMERLAMLCEKIIPDIANSAVKRVITVPGKLVNIVLA